MRARYYDPSLGRFLSADPLPVSPTAPGTLNRYPYALNNPVNRVDSTGLASGEAAPGLFGECSLGLLIVGAFFIAFGVAAVGLWGWGVASALAFGFTLEALHAAVQLGWLAAPAAIGFVGGIEAIFEACGDEGIFDA